MQSFASELHTLAVLHRSSRGHALQALLFEHSHFESTQPEAAPFGVSGDSPTGCAMLPLASKEALS